MERFKDLIWFKHASKMKVLVVGAGGIGSWTTMLLTRTGMQVFVVDHDYVDTTNMSGQLYASSQEGVSKVDALQQVCSTFTDRRIHPIQNIIQHAKIMSGINQDQQYKNFDIIIMALDNMTARRYVFEMFYKNAPRDSSDLTIFKSILIDGRLLAEQFEIFCIKTEDEALEYRAKYLFAESEVEEAPCTAKQTSHYGAGIAFNIVRFVTNWISQKFEGIPTYVPFRYELRGLMDDNIDVHAYTTENKEEALVVE